MGVLQFHRPHPAAAWLLIAVVAVGGCGGRASTPHSSAPRTSPAQAVARFLSQARAPALAVVPSAGKAAAAMRRPHPAVGPLRVAARRFDRASGALVSLSAAAPQGGVLLSRSYADAAAGLRSLARAAGGRTAALAAGRGALLRASREALAWEGALTRIIDRTGAARPGWLTTPPATVQSLLHAAQTLRVEPPADRTRLRVEALQERLAALSYLPAGYRTGILDYRTVQAVMAFQGWEGITRDGVAGPQTRKRLLIAAPPRPWSATGRHVEVHIAQQVLLLVDGGRVVRAIHVSTAAPGHVTPTGSFTVYRKERMSWSVPFQVWMPYASYFTGGYAMHEYPDVPPYPASHGCIRLPAGDALVVWDFAGIGTPVVIH